MVGREEKEAMYHLTNSSPGGLRELPPSHSLGKGAKGCADALDQGPSKGSWLGGASSGWKGKSAQAHSSLRRPAHRGVWKKAPPAQEKGGKKCASAVGPSC